MIEKILERLELSADGAKDSKDLSKYSAYKQAIEIVQEVAKDGGWIPCSERLPEYKWISVVHWATLRNKAGLVCTRKMRWCGNGKWIWVNGHDLGSEWEVIAWKPYKAPEPWKGGK